MATEIQTILIIALTILGGVISAVLGWADSGEPWDARKFIATAIRAGIGAGTLALGFQGVTDISVWVYLSAFLSGAGADILGKRIQEVAQQKPTPPPAPTPPATTDTKQPT